MDHALVVRSGQALRDLHRVGEDLAERKAIPRHPLTQGRSTQQLGDDVRPALVVSDVVDGDDVRMIESGGGARLLFES